MFWGEIAAAGGIRSYRGDRDSQLLFLLHFHRIIKNGPTFIYYRYSLLYIYRTFSLYAATDLYCGLKFKHTVSSEISAVGVKFSINSTTVRQFVQLLYCSCTALLYCTAQASRS